MSQLVDRWELGHFSVVMSPALLRELSEVSGRPRLRKHMKSDPQVLLDLLDHDAILVEDSSAARGASRDPKDNIFISCAIEGKAQYVVSGDGDLKVLEQYEGIQMVSPWMFLQILDSLSS